MIPNEIILAIGIAICLLGIGIFYMEINYNKRMKRIEERLDRMSKKTDPTNL